MTSEGATRALAPRAMPRVRDVWVEPGRGRSDVGVDPAVPDAEPVGRPGVGLRRGVNPTDWVEAVYEEFHSEIYSFALRSTREVAAAEDATQEAFIRLLREARENRAPDDPRAWLYRVISNLVISGGRRATVAQRWRAVIARRETPTNPSPEATAMRRERRDAVQIALDALSPDARTALLLAANGFSGREIAHSLGRTELATRALLCRARTHLRETLEAPDGD
jgi:RNA polymerase sigma-70 factor, ECF subfamily